jgi:hypothetical protein
MKVFTCVNHFHQKRFKWLIKYELYVSHSIENFPPPFSFFFLFVLESLDISPKQLLIPANETGQYSIRLHCILTDYHTGRRHHEIHWWHNNKRLGSHSNRHARITKNFTQHSFISTLFYTGEPSSIAGNYICESDPLRRSISVGLKTNQSPGKYILRF